MERQFDAVQYMRQQRYAISVKLSNMTKDEIIEYVKKRESESQIRPSA